MNRFLIFLVLGATLWLCACAPAQPNRAAAMPTDAAPRADTPAALLTPEAVMHQMLAALDAKDVPALSALISPQLAQREVSIQLGLERWHQRRRSREVSKDYDALGAPQSIHIQKPAQLRDLTVIRAVIEHEHGADDLTLWLQQTPRGFEVVQWNTELVRDARGRVHKIEE